jgi:predicted MPP superfamily phosphohydrolase
VRKKTIIILTSIALAILFVVAAFYNGLIVRRYTVQTDKMDAGESFRIVLITDLHSHIYGENQSDLVSLIKEQQPDVLLLAGDIVDDKMSLRGVRLLLEGIRGIAPAYYVTGNHEFWSFNADSIKEIARSYGVRVLEGEYEQRMAGGTVITFAGIDDPDRELFERPAFDWEGEMEEAFLPLRNASGFKILLAHRPERINEYKKYGFDLVLSGHTHGGQVRIPLIMNGMYAPDQGWFPKYAGGMYRHGALTHIVSRGSSNPIRIPRIFNPPEVVVADIKGSAQ